MAQAVTLYLHGLPSKKTTVRVVEVRGGMVLTESDYGRAYYDLGDGRKVGPDGSPAPWDFWRLSAEDRRRLRAAMSARRGGVATGRRI